MDLTDMNIDPNTGLPELPEGYFFEVRSNAVHIMKSLPDVKAFMPIGSKFDDRNENGWKNYGDLKWEPVYNTAMFSGERLIGNNLTVTDRRQVFITVEARPITKANLPMLAEQAYNDLTAKLEQESLIGRYPPKKLES